MNTLVCSLFGKNVHQNKTIIGTIKDLSSLNKVREYCKSHYNLEFTEEDKSQMFGYHYYDVINSTLDVTLMIEPIKSLE